MAEINNNITDDSVVVQVDDTYNKRLNPKPAPQKNIGIDVSGEFDTQLIDAATNNSLDISAIESFTQVSQSRNQLYDLIDTMAEDTTIASVLETYAEDATVTNADGRIVYVEADDADVNHYITFLLDSLNIDKNIYQWIYSLCKYGDVYLRLYRQSDFEDSLFEDTKKKKTLTEHFEQLDEEQEENIINSLNESVKLNLYPANDKYAHYIEMVANPAEMFELTKLGKSYAYIQAKVPVNDTTHKDANFNHILRYMFNKNDVNIFDATNFAHACLLDNTSRVPEEVEIFMNNNMEEEKAEGLKYRVRKGQSLLYNTFKIWRELMLLENALLLNRITKSALVRIIGVEVADMPKEQIGPHLQGIKRLFEQKTALNTGVSMTEYTNPGPMENNIYVPTHGSVGGITVTAVGGDVDVKGLADIDHFKNRLFAGLRVPKQFFGETDDAAGFSGGESLSIISSRYGKMVKRIQTTMLQALTDVINMMLFDKGLMTYINKFTLKMTPPVTKEDMDMKDIMQGKLSNTSDILNILNDYIEEQEPKLKIAKILLSSSINDPEVLNIIQEEIDKYEESSVEEPIDENIGDDEEDMDINVDMNNKEFNEPIEEPIDNNEEESSSEEETITLPSPDELGIDFTDNNQEF